MSFSWSARIAFTLLTAPLAGCADEAEAEPTSCDARCQDETAARSVRELLKVVYNLTLQANPVGLQDESTRCPLGGSARVQGVATSLAEQGATELALGYQLDECAYLRRDDEPEQSYDVVINGGVLQQGTLAVQPTATTALIFEAESISVAGEVFDPAVAYSEQACALRLAQDGNHLSGNWCGRKIGFDL